MSSPFCCPLHSYYLAGSFAVRSGDHLRFWDHLRSNLRIICGLGIICGAEHCSPYISYDTTCENLVKRQGTLTSWSFLLFSWPVWSSNDIVREIRYLSLLGQLQSCVSPTRFPSADLYTVLQRCWRCCENAKHCSLLLRMKQEPKKPDAVASYGAFDQEAIN